MVNAVIWTFPVPIRGDNRPNVVTMPIGAAVLEAERLALAAIASEQVA